ncbi:DUF4974 domain-containing protein [Thalassotalea euphylliae]|uniref:DUF4974 domain-containing protein n=1 Tax=Thalassotalea euphylliae TaxID=1655234 RepID=A0A3E0TW99_9GAMM|nr:FecR domain-containing protein [Thalassotalea euphylliae]REL28275.1 DUF4974 domain-containing protein [Thalassotalea euphylliae]
MNNNVVNFINASQMSNDALDVACDWIAKIDRGLTSEETQTFQSWLYEKPSNMETMLDVAKFSEKLEELNRLAEIVPEDLVKKEKPYNWHSAIAASVLVMFSLLFFFPTEEIPVTPKYAAIEKMYSTQIGEKNTIHLPDDSILILNTDSLVNIAYTDTARIIELQKGEMHIEVAHDLNRPLSVVAGEKVIQAVGTAFNVEYSTHEVELLVTDGKVLVADIDERSLKNIQKLSHVSLSVSEGQKVSLDTSPVDYRLTIETVNRNEMTKALSWQQGKLVFTGDTLEEAIKEIARYTELEIELAHDEKLRNMQIAGRFKTGDVRGLLAILEKTFNIEHKQLSTNKIRLSFKSS